MEEVVSIGIRTTVIRLDIQRAEEGYECEEVAYNHKSPLSEQDYGPLASTLIRSRYSADEVEAIQLNYLDGGAAHREEMERLQAWREESKRLAKEAIGHVTE